MSLLSHPFCACHPRVSTGTFHDPLTPTASKPTHPIPLYHVRLHAGPPTLQANLDLKTFALALPSGWNDLLPATCPACSASSQGGLPWLLPVNPKPEMPRTTSLLFSVALIIIQHTRFLSNYFVHLSPCCRSVSCVRAEIFAVGVHCCIHPDLRMVSGMQRALSSFNKWLSSHRLMTEHILLVWDSPSGEFHPFVQAIKKKNVHLWETGRFPEKI